MSLTQDFHRSPITGKMIHLPQAVSPPPAKKPKPESKSSSDWHAAGPRPFSMPYLAPAPQPQMMNPVFQTFQNCTFNSCHGHLAKSGQNSSHGKPSSGYGHHSTPNGHSSKSGHPSSHHHTWVPPTTIQRPSPPSTADKSCNRRPRKEKAVRFTESVSAREREHKKQWDPTGGHRTNYASKSGRKPEAVKVERLMCESCQVRGQEWRVDGRMLCEGCFRYREGKKAGRR